MNVAERKIWILSGPVQSGKTTRLLMWLHNKKNVWGILTPVINGQRFFMDASNKEIFAMEAIQGETDVIAVGKYIFSKDAFVMAEKVLQNSIHKKGYLIVDEIGKLEIRGEGFCNVLFEILNHAGQELRLILVIREELLDAVLQFWNINKYQNFNELNE
ncbi:MAG: hypothetical protein H0W62_06960 [Chitinophagales bacterium]|nr:hypothetical protein [Chitinophagales bacterium]